MDARVAAHLSVNPPSITVKEAANELGCSPSFIYRLMKLGQLAYEKRGRFKRPLLVSIHAYRLRNIVPAEQAPPIHGEPLASGYRFKHLFQNKKTARPQPDGQAG